jgi:hypothetical protein
VDRPRGVLTLHGDQTNSRRSREVPLIRYAKLSPESLRTAVWRLDRVFGLDDGFNDEPEAEALTRSDEAMGTSRRSGESQLTAQPP